MRLFIGPVGAEHIGRNAEGVPVVADVDGVGAMVEITGITDLRLDPGLHG